MPQYTIQDIEVSGISTLDEREIQQRVYDALGEDSGFISPRNLLWYDSEKIRSALESDIFHIARASVSRDDFFSTTLRVSIDERAPFAKWCSTEERCYAIDETGFIFDPLTASSTQTFAETFTFFGGVTSTSTPLGAYVAPARFPSALSIMRTLGQAGYTPVRASIDSDTDVSIVFNTGFTLYASFGAEPPALVRNLKLVLESEPLKDNLSNLEYVDLRFGNRVFYKLKGQEAVGQ
jgi:cell division septal protein FtsQ